MIDLIRTIFNEWKEKKFPEIIKRKIDLIDYAFIKPKKIIVITGFRRTGKTYLIFDLIKTLLEKKSEEEIVYVNFEDERIPLKTEFLTSLIPSIKQLSKNTIKFLFLDEIQNMPHWSKWLRRIYDNEDITIFVTGSSSKMSSREIPTELRGRFLEITLFPLSFKEFLIFKNIHIDTRKTDHTKNDEIMLMRSLEEYLNFGSMPEVVLANEGRKLELIHNYYNTVIRRDIIERFNIKNEESLKALLKLLLNSTSYSISKMYNTLKSLNFEIGKGTIQNYLRYIEDSYFMFSVPLFSFKMKDQLQYARKVYFIDVGFVNILSTKLSKNKGKNYENVVFLELKRRQIKKPGLEIYYWKSQQGEVDFVIKEGLKVKQLIQVCYDITDYDTKKREIRALLKASKELKCKNLLVITEDKEGEEIIKNKKIKYIPLWKWLLE